MGLVLDILSTICLMLGAGMVFVGGFGVMRMPDFYTRMHAASLTDTGGAGLIITGLLLQSDLTLAPVKLLAIFLFLFLTSPTASYALANAALLAGLEPKARNETGRAIPGKGPLSATGKHREPKKTGKNVGRASAAKTRKKKPGKTARSTGKKS
jgi:multicomponent Na+:H+ antiporter subunit G